MTDDSADVVDLTAELVNHPSENPPGDERPVVEYLCTRLDDSPVPFDVETYDVVDDRPNVVARAGDPGRGTVLLTGHVDVVPANRGDWTGDPYEARESDGRLVGRGTTDMKGALAAKLVATETYFAQIDHPGEVILAFVADEEHLGRGTRALVERGVEADAAIVGEPTELDVSVATKGVVRYRITVSGVSCHSGRPDEGVDAIAGLSTVLDRIASLDKEVRSDTRHDLLEPETVTVTEVSGGIAPNVVADEAVATVDWRFLPGPADPDAFDERLSALLAGVTVDGEPVDIEVERTVFARGAEIRASHDLVDALSQAAREAGASGDPVGFNAATDARFLANDASIPTAHFGPGSLDDDAHTVDESVAIADLATTVETYRRALERLLN